MLACIYVTDWVYIHTCMQTESELKKHEFRVIYIIAEKNCTIFLGCADWTCERDFYCEGALSVEALETWKAQGRHGGSDQLGAQQSVSRHGETLTLVPQTRINRYRTIDEKNRNKSLVYANVRVLWANHQSAFNLWVQSDTLLVAISLSSYWPESLANPKAGCHYLDQTSQAVCSR